MKSLLAPALAIVLATPPSVAGTRHQFSRPLMGTTFSITCHHSDRALAEKAAAAAFAEGARINAIASDYLPDSELSRLAGTPVGQPVAISPTLYELLDQARRIAEMTGGRYDPSLGPLTRLWRETRRSRRLPDPETLAAARRACGWRHFSLDPDTRAITLKLPGMAFDLGGIAKGHAADRMLDIMRKYGVPSSSIVAGGDIAAGEAPPGRPAWRVGLKTFNPGRADEVIALENAAVSTSGDLFQHVEIDGVRYSHILDPATGLGLTRPLAVSVVAPRGTLSDPLATAACVAGPELAASLLKTWGATDFRIRRPGPPDSP